jgi:aspartate-semialdehyde dehydrogenase
VLEDDPANQIYPMPMNAHGKDETFVGRIRRDESQPKTVNMWIVADNLRKGAATNAVQIAQDLLNRGLVK